MIFRFSDFLEIILKTEELIYLPEYWHLGPALAGTTGYTARLFSGSELGGNFRTGRWKHAYLSVLAAEVQGLQKEGGELGLVGGELLLPHDPNVLAQDAHKWAHEILKTHRRCARF